MPRFQDHPTAQAVLARPQKTLPTSLRATELRQLCLDSGADDVGFVSIDRPELDDQRADILRAFPATKTLISFVCRMNREPIRSVARSVANAEFHSATDETNEVGRRIVRALGSQGIAAVNPASGFPMEMSNFPDKIWVVSHKPVAVAAGLGQMGIHRNVIHPKFGNFILLGTVLVAAEVDTDSAPIEYNPCLTCKLCVAACPVGAVKADGQFDPGACLTHNYREFMQGFTDWVEQIADSPSALELRRKVTDQETASMWQSLSFGANYKAAYCMAVCPAGEDVIGPFLSDQAQFISNTLKPLQLKAETVYVVADSDAEKYVSRRYPHKASKRVSGVRPSTIAGFLNRMDVAFQRGKSQGLDAVYHFTFTGAEPAEATVTIRNQTLKVERGLIGQSDCTVVADSKTWLGFLRKERNIFWAIIRRKIKVKGSLALFKAFGRCFPN
jgi:Fe-S-cluster-containing hydrogenase component 2